MRRALVDLQREMVGMQERVKAADQARHSDAMLREHLAEAQRTIIRLQHEQRSASASACASAGRWVCTRGWVGSVRCGVVARSSGGGYIIPLQNQETLLQQAENSVQCSFPRCILMGGAGDDADGFLGSGPAAACE